MGDVIGSPGRTNPGTIVHKAVRESLKEVFVGFFNVGPGMYIVHAPKQISCKGVFSMRWLSLPG